MPERPKSQEETGALMAQEQLSFHGAEGRKTPPRPMLSLPGYDAFRPLLLPIHPQSEKIAGMTTIFLAIV